MFELVDSVQKFLPSFLGMNASVRHALIFILKASQDELSFYSLKYLAFRASFQKYITALIIIFCRIYLLLSPSHLNIQLLFSPTLMSNSYLVLYSRTYRTDGEHKMMKIQDINLILMSKIVQNPASRMNQNEILSVAFSVLLLAYFTVITISVPLQAQEICDSSRMAETLLKFRVNNRRVPWLNKKGIFPQNKW